MQPKRVALLSLVFLIVASFATLLVVFWRMWEVIPPVSTPATQNEQVLKEKLENYSKRADDLQKLTSLLVGFTTIYAIVLAISAYTTVQNNLQQADKSIARLDDDVKDHLKRAETAIQQLDRDVKDSLARAERATARLDGLISDHQALMEKTRVEFPRELEQVRQSTTYFGRLALATAASAFPLDSDDYKDVQESVIHGLLELRSGQYSTDPIINQRLARLYKAQGRFRNAEEVMTGFIERKERLGERDDPAVVDAYYDRACYRVFRLATTRPEDKNNLIEAIESDLTRAFSFNDALKRHASEDDWLKTIRDEDWFKNLLAN